MTEKPKVSDNDTGGLVRVVPCGARRSGRSGIDPARRARRAADVQSRCVRRAL